MLVLQTCQKLLGLKVESEIKLKKNRYAFKHNGFILFGADGETRTLTA